MPVTKIGACTRRNLAPRPFSEFLFPTPFWFCGDLCPSCNRNIPVHIRHCAQRVAQRCWRRCWMACFVSFRACEYHAGINPESTTFLVSVDQSPRMSAHASDVSGLSRLKIPGCVLADVRVHAFTVFLVGKVEKLRI